MIENFKLKFKNYLERLRGLSDKNKKIVLWTIVAVLGIIMGLFWINGTMNSLSKLGSQVGEMKLPDIEMSQTEALDNLANANETASWKTYTNEEYGFEIKYPTDWSYEEASQSLATGKTTRFINPEGIYVIEINNPIREIGYESHKLIKTDQIKIKDSDKYFIVKTFEPIISGAFNSLIIATWDIDNWENSGEIILTYPPRNNIDPNIEIFNQILSTFKFIQ